MRLLIACAVTLFLVTAGCTLLEKIATRIAFADHPIYLKATDGGSTWHDLLAIQEPDRVTTIGDGASQCFDYTLKSGSKSRPLYVVFTEAEKVDAYGFSMCAMAAPAESR